jgi:hypothetical protein
VEEFVNCLSSNPLHRRHAVAAALLLVYPAFASAQETAPDSFRELETKYIFGFTTGSDIGPEGERELEFETNLRFQRRGGVYNQLEQEVEIEYNPTDSFQIEPAVHGVFTQIHGVEGFENRESANFGGLGSILSYVLIGRGPGAPAGVTISVEPEWSRIDDGGRLITGFSAQTRIIADTELVPNRLFAAVNAIYTPEITRNFGSPKWAGASLLGLTTALTYRITPNVTLGGELEYYRAYDGAGLNAFAGHALYAGPTCFIELTNKIHLAAAFSTQIAGHAAGKPNPLDLTNFSRNNARLRALFEF